MIRLAFLVLACWFAATAAALAHESRPAFLQLIEVQPDVHEVLFKVPARGELRLSLVARLPGGCETVVPVRRRNDGRAFRDTWTVRCKGGLGGKTIAIEGLEGTLTDALVRLESLDGSARLLRLRPESTAGVVPMAPSLGAQARTYLLLGVEHILLGIDHLLFVLGLLLLIGDLRKLAVTITAFTVAHSLTLGAATLGLVHVPPAPVEAVIALSIVFVAAEIVHGRQGRPGLTARRPWIAAFAFGLLHGFGFAGALAEVGLPEASIPLALLFFNLGVEGGQLLFILAVGVVLFVARRAPWTWPAWSWRVPAYTIGGLAAFWTIERTLATLF